MAGNEAASPPAKLEVTMIVCWLLGSGSLFCWNSMLTIEDYYSYLFPVISPSWFSLKPFPISKFLAFTLNVIA
ncbi:hypothetical protein RJ641_017396 [Dillenia turbinata]|uniref:Uncharacterized protein n=1 Tax=Dillenia turbinata TaxID=194707 RepID=A0AAN8YXN3_9MAGN